MIRPGFAQRHCLLAWLLCLCAPVFATTPGDLVAAGRLQVESSLAPGGVLVPGQRATLTLTVATDRWFAGGTRISIPEVPGLVILQTEQFANNASEIRSGQSWVLQRWNLDVYPQRAGEFAIGPVRLLVKVNDAQAGTVEGPLESPAVNFSAAVPQSLSRAQEWVAAPAFTVAEHFDRSLENLQVGDAFERTIVFEAEDVMAMMLPAVSVETVPGLTAYPSPPVLENSNNRGQTLASRTQRISYVVEAEGDYKLLGRDFFWWDTVGAKLRLLSLPATPITVGSTAAARNRDQAAPGLSPRQVLAAAIALLLLLVLAWVVHRVLRRLPRGRYRATLSGFLLRLRNLRKPALPERLNPDSSAVD